MALRVDLADAGATGLAALQGIVSWPQQILTLDSVRAVPGTGFTLTANTAEAASAGILRLNVFGTEVLAASGPVAQLYFTAGSRTAGSRIGFTADAAGNAAGQSILPLLRLRAAEACVARRVAWGDASDDGAVNIIDAQQLARFGLGLSVIRAEAVRQRGDVNDNGTIDVIDAQQVARWSIGLSAASRLGSTTLAVPSVASLQVSTSTVLLVGRTALLSASPADSVGGWLTGCHPVAWSTSNPAVATVDQGGLVSSAAAGTAEITAVSGGRRAVGRVTVRSAADPAAISTLVRDAVNLWAMGRQDFNVGLLLNSMADHYTAAWNNWNLRYYSSYGRECPQRCGWANSASSSFYQQVEIPWYRYYAALVNTNIVLAAIRQEGVTVGSGPTTRMVEAAAAMLQGVALGAIALNYDRGFLVDETTLPSTPSGLPLRGRAELRDAALAKLEAAYQLAVANTFTTPSTWLGDVNGPAYTNLQVAKLIRTLQAELLAQYPRNVTENAQVNWTQVATYASQGLSAVGGVDIAFYQDLNNWYDGVKNWGNDPSTIRVDTRVAAIITDGAHPAKVHVTPWPDMGNPIPDAYDRRVGDGSWGPSNDLGTAGTYAATPKAGTDFAYTSTNPFAASQGTYHRSQLGHIRYSYLASAGYGLPSENGQGLAPFYTQAYNDLLWAEGLLRGGGSKPVAAGLINKTRVTRGGLTPLTGGETDAVLLRALQYEQLIETMGLGGVPFYNLRRVTPAGYAGINNAGCPALLCLWPGTPRHLPVPAKELGLLSQELYTFGGPGNPESVAPAGSGSGSRIRGVREIAAEHVAQSRAALRDRSRR